MSRLHDAIHDGDCSTALDLMEGGYTPTATEWQELRAALTFRRGPKQKAQTRCDLERKARAKLRYRELRANDIPPEAALETVEAETKLHREALRYIVNGGDRRVDALLSEWRGIPNN